MADKICIKCRHAKFLNPKKEICYRTGGLYCVKLKEIVGKYEPCRISSMKTSKKKK